jgi:hypothetical protein
MNPAYGGSAPTVLERREAGLNETGGRALSSVRLIQCLAFVHRNVVGLIALYFVLRFILASAMRIPLVINILCVNLDDLATDAAGLRIPAYVTADFESFFHQSYPRIRN